MRIFFLFPLPFRGLFTVSDRELLGNRFRQRSPSAQRWACVRGKPKVGSSQEYARANWQALLLDFRPLWHGRPAGLPLAGRPVARLCCPPTGKFLQCSNAVATLAKLLARWRILHGRVAVLYFLPQPTSNYH
ncbi:Replication protein [Trichinella pseudospiralis]